MAVVHQHPFNIDYIVKILDRTALSPVGAAVVAFLTAISTAESGFRFTLPALFKRHKWLGPYLAFVGLKTLNNAAARLAINNGWSADPPKWGKGNEVIIITGGAGGIGAAFVDQMAKKTKKIAVLDLAEPQYKAQGVKFYKCDVTKPEQIREVADKIRNELGPPTILINNAGIAKGKRILEVTPAEFMMVYRVNVLGALNMIKEFLPYMISINHGHVQTVASSASYMAIAQLAEYSCSKSAVLALHETLAQELVHRYNAPKVRHSVICPTKVRTPLGQNMEDHPSEFFTPVLDPWQVAEEMVKHVESGLSGYSVMPFYASMMLPSIRSLPEWNRWLSNTIGKTYNTINDKRIAAGTYKDLNEDVAADK